MRFSLFLCLSLMMFVVSLNALAFIFPDKNKVASAHTAVLSAGKSLEKSTGNTAKNIKALGKFDQTFETYLAREQSDLDIMRRNLVVIEKQYDENKSEIDKTLQYYRNVSQKEGMLNSKQEAAYNSLIAAKAKYDEELRIRRDDLNQRQTLVEQQYTSYMNTVQNEDLAAKVEEASRDIQNKITRGTHTLGTKMSELKYDALTLDQKLNALGDHYDQRIMGAYIKDKMTKLLNSDVLCLAATQCSGEVKKDEALVGSGNMVEIFESPESRSNKSLKSKSIK